MQIRVLFFGVLKDLMGRSMDTVDLPAGARVDDLLSRYLQGSRRLQEMVPSLALSVNQEYAQSDRPLQEGDEVALLPPVSGGSAERASKNRVRILREPISTQAVLDDLKLPDDGAAVVFEGVVRNQTRGRRTLYLDYEAYEAMALRQMESLADEARTRFAIRDLAILHRVGRLEIGEISVLIVVASAHRAPAFEACRWVIDTLKKSVPIWKKEYFEDGAVWADGEPFPGEIRGPLGTAGTLPASK
jgi:MoaE-MoaD fusion protein